ncbi:MAG: NADH-quinone oxidoreductase subunit G [Gammaproteobacteria bacterium]|nr:NADH-quinone oxidoreductase subunit G [Gammaproteobacteria bacterium]
MSTDIQPEDRVNIEINDQPYQARKGQMLIEITDANDIEVPRFCYHNKLPIAASCRMCLVQVEKAPKPLPACATPVMEGMKVYTRSAYAHNAQKAVMEFLLINHPLDCPICDQGGECELQDIAFAYGRDVSRFAEGKRVVEDKNIGPLIATDMTRCIHCTRCVRFMQVIAGSKELGGISRGENLSISTYIEQSIDSEMSGNIIDVCPVGALTSKPARYQARAWELSQFASVAAHDCVGSNLNVHSRRGQVMRVVPRDNEAVNEVWISDRDRYSYQALTHEERLLAPEIKVDGQWQQVSWDEALQRVVEGLADKADDLGILVSPSASIEEMSLLTQIGAGLKCNNIDYRLRQQDFSGQDQDAVFPWLGQSLEELEQTDCVLLIGSNVRKEQPLVAHRLRKASLDGARLMVINPVDYDFHFNLSEKSIVLSSAMVAELAAVAQCVGGSDKEGISAELQALIAGAEVNDQHRAMADALQQAEKVNVILGNHTLMHVSASALKALAALIAEQTGAVMGCLTDGANAAGAALAGVLPHRSRGGHVRSMKGLNVAQMLADSRQAYLLYGCEPAADFIDSVAAQSAMQSAGFVVACNLFASDQLRACADVLLPIAAFAEMPGSYVNTEGCWQTFNAATKPPAEVRPGWKVLRVLGNLLRLNNFDYLSSAEVRDELYNQVGEQGANQTCCCSSSDLNVSVSNAALEAIVDLPAYAVDGLVRRADALQQTRDGQQAHNVRVCTQTAHRNNLQDGDRVRIKCGDTQTVMILVVDDAVPVNGIWLATAVAETADLTMAASSIELEKE